MHEFLYIVKHLFDFHLMQPFRPGLSIPVIDEGIGDFPDFSIFVGL
jgi:hypothetical protein